MKTNECVLFSIVSTSSIHQYPIPLFWGTCAECEAEREKCNPDSRHSLKVARVEDLGNYRS